MQHTFQLAKKQLFLCCTLFCTFPCHCLLPIFKNVLRRKCLYCVLPVHSVFFTATHFHLGSHQRFSFCHCRHIISFMFFFQPNWSPLLFISRSSSFPVIQVNVDIKIQWKERLIFLLFVFSSLKVWAAMRLTAETSGVPEMQTFTSTITYSSPDGLTPDSRSPPPESVRSAFGRTLTS